MKRLRQIDRLTFWHWIADAQLVALWLWGLWKHPVPTLALSSLVLYLLLALAAREKR